jgi:hypothetical protein
MWAVVDVKVKKACLLYIEKCCNICPILCFEFFVAHNLASMGEKEMKNTGKIVATKQYVTGEVEKNERGTYQNLT